jgi:hypothetical protein
MCELTARHAKGTAWARHAMYESAFTLPVFTGNYPARQFASCPRINSVECYVLIDVQKGHKINTHSFGK